MADQYGSHVYLREALKGVPRENYVIQTKTHATNFADARSHLDGIVRLPKLLAPKGEVRPAA